jgi:predicted ATPase
LLRDAQRHLEEGLVIDQFVLPGRPPLLSSDADGRFGSRMFMHNCLLFLGWPAKARRFAEQAAVQMPSQQYSLAIAHNFRCRMHVFERDAQKAAEVAEVLFRVATEHGYPLFVGSSSSYKGWALAHTGSPHEGCELCLRGISQLRAVGTICYLPHYLMLLAECRDKAGDPDGALRVIEEAFSAMYLTGERLWEAELYRIKGQLLLTSGAEPALAEQSFNRALTVAKNQQTRLLELRAATQLARLLAQSGRKSEAHVTLSRAYNWFTEGFDNPDLEEAHAVLARLESQAHF